jgi:Ca-activated chloride channel family protein
VNFGFDNIFIFISAFFIIPAAVIIYSRMKNPFVAAIPLGAPGGVPFKTSQINGIVRLLRFMELTGIFLLFFSAAGPSMKTVEIVWLNRGADIIFVLDVSPSMAAVDMDGKNRYDAGKTMIAQFAYRRPTDSIGLVAFGEDAALLLPPTSDRQALELRLEQLRIGEMGDSTALGMGLAVAAYHLDKSSAKRKIAVLITDGENNAGSIHPETSADLLRELGISFWVIAVGSMGQVPIDYIDPYTKIRRTGIFDSRYDTESLRRLCAAGSGTFIPAVNAEAFASAFSQLDDAEITVQRSRVINRMTSVSFQFLLAGVILLTAVKIIRRFLLRAML